MQAENRRKRCNGLHQSVREWGSPRRRTVWGSLRVWGTGNLNVPGWGGEGFEAGVRQVQE
jgi:hypothetical protein